MKEVLVVLKKAHFYCPGLPKAMSSVPLKFMIWMRTGILSLLKQAMLWDRPPSSQYENREEDHYIPMVAEFGLWGFFFSLSLFFYPPFHSSLPCLTLLTSFYCTCLYMGKGTPGRNPEWHLQNNHLYSAHISPQQYYTDSPWKANKQDS